MKSSRILPEFAASVIRQGAIIIVSVDIKNGSPCDGTSRIDTVAEFNGHLHEATPNAKVVQPSLSGGHHLTGAYVTLTSAASLVSTYWVIPAGMIALYYYGWFHFNTPDYALESSEAAQSEEGVLRILVPPKFTTNRSQYNRYARLYILSLETAFLTFVFLPKILATAAGIADQPAAAAAFAAVASRSLEYRGIFVFMGLAGVLPSLPLFKQFDGWVLKQFHKGGLIPQDIRLMADRLYGAKFQVTKDVARQASEDFSTRDTIRVSQEKAKGSLERHLLRTGRLRKQLEAVFADAKFDRSKIRLDRDLKDVFRISRLLQNEAELYFKDQERLVPADETDIDAFLEKIVGADSAGNEREFGVLKQRRAVLKDKCDSLYYRMCLITALMVFSVEARREDVYATLRSIGFSIVAKPRLEIDWSTIFYITTLLFVITLLFDSEHAVIFFFYHIPIPETAKRVEIFAMSVVESALYGAIIYMAILIKERPSRPGSQERVQNADKVAVTTGCCCYLLALPVIYMAAWYFHHKLLLSPLLYAAPYGVAGYFIVRYIDFYVDGGAVSWRLTFWHVLCQSVIGIISSAFLIVSFWPKLLLCLILFASGVLEPALIALVISQMFQRLYGRRTRRTGTHFDTNVYAR